MRAQLLTSFVLALVATHAVSAINIRLGGPHKTVHEHRREEAESDPDSYHYSTDDYAYFWNDIDPLLLYKAHTISTPVDHFHNESRYEPHTNASFPLRYWFDAQYYKPGGPVIVLQGGESSGAGRLTFLQKGILHKLAMATNGIGVVLEHRYYGTSFPTKNLSTHSLRFLSTQQAMADEVYFAQNVKFPGLEKHGDLTARTTAYIGYGGSYAGAFTVFLRVLYPDVFWGAISSSGVTKVRSPVLRRRICF